MRWVKAIIEDWREKTPKEKVETVIQLISGIGMSMVCGDIGQQLGAKHSPVGKACITVGMSGLGMYAGDIAGKELVNLVENLDLIRESSKKAKEAN